MHVGLVPFKQKIWIKKFLLFGSQELGVVKSSNNHTKKFQVKSSYNHTKNFQVKSLDYE